MVGEQPHSPDPLKYRLSSLSTIGSPQSASVDEEETSVSSFSLGDVCPSYCGKSYCEQGGECFQSHID